MITFNDNLLLVSGIKVSLAFSYAENTFLSPLMGRLAIKSLEQRAVALQRRNSFFEFDECPIYIDEFEPEQEAICETPTRSIYEREVKVFYQRPEPPTEPLRGMPIRPITGCDMVHVKASRRVGGNWHNENGATPAHLTDSFSED